jgi:predicted RNase H-like HicB family nuclease
VPVYLAVIHRIPGCEYRIQFPDFPGVETHTVDLDEVRDEAKRTLFEEIRRRGRLQESLPRPTSKEDLQLELTYREGLLVPFEVDESRDAQSLGRRGARIAASSRRRTVSR